MPENLWHPLKKRRRQPKTAPETTESKDKATDVTPEEPLILVLERQAKAFSDMGENEDALIVYNQALALTAPEEQPRLLEKIETVLSKTDPDIIARFIETTDMAIPKALLVYWYGLNHASMGNTEPARFAFEEFLAQYPDHPYAEDARDLLSDILASLFKRDTIGCLLPLSGKYGTFGQRALAGVQMAVADLSKSLGTPLNLVVKDTRSDAGHAAVCVEELAGERVIGILGPLVYSEAAGAAAERLQIPLIAMTQKEAFPGMGRFLFAHFITPKMQADALAAYVFNELNLERVAILYPEERYGRRLMELFWDAVDIYGGQVVGVESYDGTGTDFTLPIQKLTGEHYPLPDFLKPEPDPDEVPAPESTVRNTRGSKIPEEERIEIDFQALFIPDSPSRINMILPQLAFNDARGMVLLGTNLWHHPSLLTDSAGYNRDAVITDGYFGTSANPRTRDFHERYGAIFDEVPGFLEAIAYDTAAMLFESAMAEGVTTRERLRNELAGSRIFEGVTGTTVFDETGRARKELFLITIAGKKFVEIRR